MAEAVLLLSAVSTLLVAASYAYVARRLAGKKSGSAEGDRALRAFAVWWGATAFNQVLGSALYAAAALGYASFEMQLSYVVAQRALLALSLAGLLDYLLFLARGRHALPLLGAGYAAFFAFSLWTVIVSEPTRVVIGRWRTDLAYAGSAPALAEALHGALIILPPVVASVVYLSLVRRVDTRSRRLRALTLSIGLIVWWVLAVVAGQRALLDNDAVQLANRAVGLAVAVAILLSFEPTPWMRRRLRVEPFPA